MRKEIELLEHHADLLAQRLEGRAIGTRTRIVVAFGRERPVDPNRAALDRLERGEAAEQRALPRPARPDDDQNLARAELQVDVVQDSGGSVTLDQPLDDDERLRGHEG
jgi:hypothetical protein